MVWLWIGLRTTNEAICRYSRYVDPLEEEVVWITDLHCTVSSSEMSRSTVWCCDRDPVCSNDNNVRLNQAVGCTAIAHHRALLRAINILPTAKGDVLFLERWTPYSLAEWERNHMGRANYQDWGCLHHKAPASGDPGAGMTERDLS
jgi:hypothetical protein